MDGSKPKIGAETVARSYPDRDVDALLERVWTHLGGTVSRSAIRQVLAEVIPNYESAPIQTFVPIFVYKESVKRLQAELAEAPPHHRVEEIRNTGLAVRNSQS